MDYEFQPAGSQKQEVFRIRQERLGVFETNSSSTHSVCITKDRRSGLIFPEKLIFRCQNFGWEERKLDTPESKAAYLYATILTLYTRKDVEAAKNRIFTVLGDLGIECSFEPAEYASATYPFCGIYTYCTNACVDHAFEDDLPQFAANVLRSRGRLIRYLFSSQSFVLTGNDNENTDINIQKGYRHEEYYKGG